MDEYTVKVYKEPRREGRTEWFNLQGQRHRVNGPAIHFPDGREAYFLNGQMATKEEVMSAWHAGAVSWSRPKAQQ